MFKKLSFSSLGSAFFLLALGTVAYAAGEDVATAGLKYFSTSVFAAGIGIGVAAFGCGIGQGIGMSVNNACQFAIAKGLEYDEDFISSLAIKIYQLAEDLKQQAADGGFELATKVSKAIDEEVEEDDPF